LHDYRQIQTKTDGGFPRRNFTFGPCAIVRLPNGITAIAHRTWPARLSLASKSYHHHYPSTSSQLTAHTLHAMRLNPDRIRWCCCC